MAACRRTIRFRRRSSIRWGHRNPQGIDWQPGTGELWGTEHGATGNDELNRLLPGARFRLAGDRSQSARRRAWRRPCSSTIRRSRRRACRSTRRAGGASAIGGYEKQRVFCHLARDALTSRNQSRRSAAIGSEEQLLGTRFGKIRDVITGPDGAIYFCTNNRDGHRVADERRRSCDQARRATLYRASLPRWLAASAAAFCRAR